MSQNPQMSPNVQKKFLIFPKNKVAVFECHKFLIDARFAFLLFLVDSPTIRERSGSLLVK